MTDTPPGFNDLTSKEFALVAALAEAPVGSADLADRFNISPTTVKGRIERVRNRCGADAIEWIQTGPNDGHYRLRSDLQDAVTETDSPSEAADESDDTTAPDFSDTPVAEDEPDPSDLTERERYIVRQLQQGVSFDALVDDLGERPRITAQYLRELRRDGWRVYRDDTAGHVAIKSDHLLRSSEHIGTRTRKANRWWEATHNELVRQFKALSTPDADLDATTGREDWVCHLTDLHAGDRVRRDDGTVVYETSEVPAVIDYVTEQALALADKHDSTYDVAHLLWGGDFVTNEGIYEGQFEDLDAWLDEQHDTLVAPLIRQIKAFAERFPTVNIVCQVGNHGRHRASGTSRQANADLICYKHIRNTVAELQRHADVLGNVRFRIGQAQAYRNFPLRGGRLRGHLRHGHHRKPQAETSARKKEWLATLREHEFDIAAIGHHHVAGRIPWDGPPVICSPSPKPAGEFVKRLGERVAGGPQGVATVFGVSDDGLTTVFPVDTRKFDPDQ